MSWNQGLTTKILTAVLCKPGGANRILRQHWESMCSKLHGPQWTPEHRGPVEECV